MCGIGGILRMKDSAITDTQLASLLLGLERRGNDAAGIALSYEDGTVLVHKAPGSAFKLLDAQEYRDFLAANLTDKVKIALVHTRAKTCGSERDNTNNHPLTAGKCAVVHNGIIGNHRELFAQLSLSRTAETDSDILRAILDQHGLTETGVEKLRVVHGTAALAAVHPDYPNRVLLARSGNPLEIGVTDEFIFWASERSPIAHANRRWETQHGIPAFKANRAVSFSQVPVDTAWLLDTEKGLVWHRPFTTARYERRPFVCSDDYSRKMAKIIKHSRTCASCGQDSYISRKQRKKPLWEIQCRYCQEQMARKP